MEKESVNEVKEKNLFFSMIRAIVLAVIIFSFIFTIQRNGITEKENLINAFNSNEQIVCSSKIVSLNTS